MAKSKDKKKEAAKKAVDKKAADKKQQRLSMPQLLQKEQQLLSEGKNIKAAKVTNRINKMAVKNPETAAPIGQQWAQQEFQQNLNANRPDQYTIGGQQTYTVDPVTGKTIVNQGYSPEQQALYDQQVAQAQMANQAFANAFQQGNWGQRYDLSGAPTAPQMGDLGAARSQMESELYDRNMVQVNKTFDRQREQLEQQLYSQGHMPGSPQYQQRMDDLNQTFAANESQVRSQAIQGAGQEFERSFNLGTQGRQNYINEEVFKRQQPLSEMQTIAGFGGGPTVTPQFFGFQPVQYSGPQYADYLKMGVENQLGQGALAVDRAQIAAAGRGGGGGGGEPAIPFSIGAAPGSIPVVPNYPNAAGSNFTQGFQGGVNLGVAASAGRK